MIYQNPNLHILNCHIQMFFLWRSSHLSLICGRNGGIKRLVTKCMLPCPRLMTSITRDAQTEKINLLLIIFEYISYTINTFIQNGEQASSCIMWPVKHIMIECVSLKISRRWHYDMTDSNWLFKTVTPKKTLDFVKDIGLYNSLQPSCKLHFCLLCLIAILLW